MMPAAQDARPEFSDACEFKVTNGTVALLNLQAQIEGLEPDARLGLGTVKDRVALVELIILRGLILGRVADYERAAELAEQLVRDAPTNAAAFVARAQVRAVFHRFTEALDDIDLAERHSIDAEITDVERATIFQALGRYDDALAVREEAARRCPGFATVAALAGLCAERGDIERAERLHAESKRRYRGVSPFPLALLDFQIGLMWMYSDRPKEARATFEAARRHVPACAPAQGHLAEIEAQLGDTETAIARLYSLTVSSDDPDYAAQLARILDDAGRADESRHWREFAAARYDELIARHPEAFADHAAEFWLAAGGDPHKALRLALMNLEVRRTPRAHDLLEQAVIATKLREQPCSLPARPCPRSGRS